MNEEHDTLAEVVLGSNLAIPARVGANLNEPPKGQPMSTATLSRHRAKPEPAEVLAYRKYVTTNLSRGVDVTNLPIPSVSDLMANYGTGPAVSGSTPRGRVEQVFADHFEGDNLAAVRQATEQYTAYADQLARSNLSLSDYVATSLEDIGVGMPPKVVAVLEAEQQAFGRLPAGVGLA